MTRPMTDSEVMDLIDATNAALTEAQDRIEALEKRVRALEADTPQARQLQYEADLAAADLAASGYDRHGRDCRCPYCYYDEDEVTP